MTDERGESLEYNLKNTFKVPAIGKLYADIRSLKLFFKDVFELKSKVLDRMNAMHAMFSAYLKQPEANRDQVLLAGTDRKLEQYYADKTELNFIYQTRLTRTSRLVITCAHSGCTFRMNFTADGTETGSLRELKNIELMYSGAISWHTYPYH